jgi:hypothetical protein
MRFNEKELATLAAQHTCEKEGLLYFRERQEGFFRKNEGEFCTIWTKTNEKVLTRKIFCYMFSILLTLVRLNYMKHDKFRDIKNSLDEDFEFLSLSQSEFYVSAWVGLISQCFQHEDSWSDPKAVIHSSSFWFPMFHDRFEDELAFAWWTSFQAFSRIID